MLFRSITEFVLRIPLNSKVGSSLNSDGTRRDESPTSMTGTLNFSDSVPCNVMPLVYETVKQYATGPSSNILVLTRGSSRKQVKQVIANIQSPLHGYHHRETIDITYASEFVLRIPLNSKVGSSLNSDGTRRDESPTSMTGSGTSIPSRKLVTMLVDESATVDILCRTSRMEREGDKDL